MYQGKSLPAFAVLVVGLALGCGRPAVPTAADPPPAEEKPKASPTPAAGGKKLADLDATIAAREKELEALRAEAESLRRADAGAKSPKDKVYRSGAELLADMPRAAFPRFGPGGGVERAAARKWCRLNLPGRTIEWTATVREVADSGNDPYEVRLLVEGIVIGTGAFDSGFAIRFGEPFSLGGERCTVGLDGSKLIGSGVVAAFSAVRYGSCTADEVNRLRQFKGAKVTFQARVTRAEVSEYQWLEGAEYRKWVPIGIRVSRPSVDGFLPAADR